MKGYALLARAWERVRARDPRHTDDLMKALDRGRDRHTAAADALCRGDLGPAARREDVERGSRHAVAEGKCSPDVASDRGDVRVGAGGAPGATHARAAATNEANRSESSRSIKRSRAIARSS